VTEPRKCIKCGQLKLPTEYYSGSGNTCRECLKEAQRIRNAQKRVVTKVNMEERLRYNFCRADCWVWGVQVMRKGSLIGKTGRTWWDDKIRRHKKWLRRKRMKEEVRR